MRETIRDWQKEWIEENGESEGTEVLIKEGTNFDAPYIYEGAFKDIPGNLLDKEVVKCSQVLESSVPERSGAYLLCI